MIDQLKARRDQYLAGIKNIDGKLTVVNNQLDTIHQQRAQLNNDRIALHGAVKALTVLIEENTPKEAPVEGAK